MKLYIKYMVSLRCKMVVLQEIKNLGLHHLNIDLGQAEVQEDINEYQRKTLKENLTRSGLELLDDTGLSPSYYKKLKQKRSVNL